MNGVPRIRQRGVFPRSLRGGGRCLYHAGRAGSPQHGKAGDISACVFVLIRLKERELPDDAAYGTIRDNELVGAADCEAVRLSMLDGESLRHIRLDHNRYILPAGRTLTRVDGYYAYSCQRHPIRYVHYAERDAILNDLFRKLADG